MRDSGHIPGYRVIIITMDAHAAGPAERVSDKLAEDFPGLIVEIHAAAEWGETPEALDRAREAIANADIIIANLLFIEEHIRAVLPDLQARRPHCDAMIGIIADRQIVELTKMGDLDMSKPASGLMKVLKKLRADKKPSSDSGQKQMKMLRRLPKILKFFPGKAQDLRAWFLTMQYWLGGSDDNVEAMLRFLLGRYADPMKVIPAGAKAASPIEYPDVGLYHPRLKGRITTKIADLPKIKKPTATVGILMMRSYVLASDCRHYDTVIEALEAKGLRVLPAFAGGLDGRPAIDAYFKKEGVDLVLSLTGFSLVGGPAYNDSHAAVEALSDLDVPYICAQPLEFQTLQQWSQSDQGLGAIEATMLVALPEIDGASNPIVFAGRHEEYGCKGCDRECAGSHGRAMSPCYDRIDRLADRVANMARLHASKPKKRKVGIVLFGFPPNAGAAGTAAYLSVFESLHNTLHRMKAEGYNVTPPETVDDLRAAVLKGNAEQFGMDANVLTQVTTDQIVSDTPWLSEIEATWGPAPGKVQTNGKGVFILGAQFGDVAVVVQPGFGYEGDPMRLLFEKGFAPTHAFSAFYRWLENDFGADVLLHFGMHGALEFMPGRQCGLNHDDWPDRLIGAMPNVYLYAANNPSEATLAKRRSNAVTVTHLTPPLAASGLYRGLADLKDSLGRWRSMANEDPARSSLEEMISAQAEAIDMVGEPETLWLKLMEAEETLIPSGLHIVGRKLTAEDQATYLSSIDETDDETRARAAECLAGEYELDGIMRALSAKYIAPTPGGDLIRNPSILPTGRNIHAFDPFRMPTAFAMADGTAQAERLLAAHPTPPRTVALVLWGSDNIKSDGGPIAQALALIGARPRFDNFGRLAGADLIPLSEMTRPRIDVIITLSGIFRDLLPLQSRLLAEAAQLAALADEPLDQNFIRAHALDYAEKMGVSLEAASLRVFSNAAGAYGSNVNHLIDSAVWGEEDELADAYEARKCFSYDASGKVAKNAALLQEALKNVDVAYQNLESAELGVTTVDHYFDTLGGISRAIKRAKGSEAAIYISDQTTGVGKVRTLKDQVALETRTRALNPKFYEALLSHGHEGVRQIEAHVTNTFGWSATTGQVEPWVYQKIAENLVLDPEMRARLAALNPVASSRMANRLLEATERDYWAPDEETLDALRDSANELEDIVEGVVNAPMMAAE